jgi:hypothetical protein
MSKFADAPSAEGGRGWIDLVQFSATTYNTAFRANCRRRPLSPVTTGESANFGDRGRLLQTEPPPVEVRILASAAHCGSG